MIEHRPATADDPEPWGYLCTGKGDGWEEKDKIVRDPELIARYREQPDKWRIEPLYLHSPPPAPDGWAVVPKEPTAEMCMAYGNQFNEADELLRGANARIAELEAENRRLREALEHFVEALNDWECGDERDADCIASQPVASIITFGHLRRARAALADKGERV